MPESSLQTARPKYGLSRVLVGAARKAARSGGSKGTEIVSRHYSDSEWARIVAGVWAAERPGQVRMFMTTKRTMWSSELGREYGWVLCPIRRPSRALVVWLLANLE